MAHRCGETVGLLSVEDAAVGPDFSGKRAMEGMQVGPGGEVEAAALTKAFIGVFRWQSGWGPDRIWTNEDPLGCPRVVGEVRRTSRSGMRG